MRITYADKTSREHIRQKLGNRGVEIFEFFKDHGFDYRGYYTWYIDPIPVEYLNHPPHGFMVFPSGLQCPTLDGFCEYMYNVQCGVDLDGNDGMILYTSFAPQDEMVPKYLLGKLGDKELQLLVSERAKEMFAQWIKLRKTEIGRQNVRI